MTTIGSLERMRHHFECRISDGCLAVNRVRLLVRCLTLADALTDRGSVAEFVCREHEGNLIDLIVSRGFNVHVLSNSMEIEEHQLDLVHAKWLGAHWKIDATQTIHEIQNCFIDILIVDHYGIDYRWESQLRPFCKRIMVIDDLADRKHDCDFLLDQNFKKSPKTLRASWGFNPAVFLTKVCSIEAGST